MKGSQTTLGEVHLLGQILWGKTDSKEHATTVANKVTLLEIADRIVPNVGGQVLNGFYQIAIN